MIGKLRGLVDYIDSDHLVLDVNSIGYIIYCPSKILHNVKAGDNIALFIEYQAREDGVYLYGFDSLEVKKQFLSLITVKGVGPKLALSILSDMGIQDIYQAVLTQDKARFKNISGVGQKLAERIIIELKDRNTTPQASDNNLGSSSSNISADAISALMNLGVSRSDAYNKVTKVLSHNPDISLDLLISMSLRGSS